MYASAGRMAATCAYDSDMRLDKGHLSKQSTRISSLHHPYYLFHLLYSYVHSNRQNTAKHVSRTNLATKGIRFPMETPIESPGQAVRGAIQCGRSPIQKMTYCRTCGRMKSQTERLTMIEHNTASRTKIYLSPTSWSEIVCSSGTSIRKIR